MISKTKILKQYLSCRFLRDEGYAKTSTFLIVEVTYLVMFLFVRAVLGSYLIYKILNSQLFDMDEKLISLVFYIVSMALVYETVGYVLYRYKTNIVSGRPILTITYLQAHQIYNIVFITGRFQRIFG